MSADQLKERIKSLIALANEELAKDDPSQIYIDDLTTSIADAERTLKFYTKNPDGVQMVNGG